MLDYSRLCYTVVYDPPGCEHTPAVLLHRALLEVRPPGLPRAEGDTTTTTTNNNNNNDDNNNDT